MAYLLTFFLAFYLAYLLSFFLAYLLTFFLAFYLAYLLSFFLAYLLTFFLAFYLIAGILSRISSGILSGSLGRAVPTQIGISRLRFGTAHSTQEVPVEVRRCPLRRPARRGRGRDREEQGRRKEEGRRRWVAPIKSNNPDLAGGEKGTETGARPVASWDPLPWKASNGWGLGDVTGDQRLKRRSDLFWDTRHGKFGRIRENLIYVLYDS